MPTPAQEAEVESLMSATRSPVPSLDINRRPGAFTADNAIPGLDINPPAKASGADGAANDDAASGRRSARDMGGGGGEGIGGWISRMVNRSRGDRAESGQAGTYRRLGQEED